MSRHICTPFEHDDDDDDEDYDASASQRPSKGSKPAVASVGLDGKFEVPSLPDSAADTMDDEHL